jgi:hypothetical protein
LDACRSSFVQLALPLLNPISHLSIHNKYSDALEVYTYKVMKILLILLAFILSISCVPRKKDKVNPPIKTIHLTIELIIGCTEFEYSNIVARSQNGKFIVSHFNDSLRLVNRYKVDSVSFINAIDSFELESNVHNGCGGYVGGMGYSIDKSVNNESVSNFGFCIWGNSDEWNGFEYFYSLYDRIEIDDEKH